MRYPSLFLVTLLDIFRAAALYMDMTNITSIKQLPACKSTYGARIGITADTDVNIPGMYLDFDGGGESTALGARWTLRQEGTEARVRDLVIVSA